MMDIQQDVELMGSQFQELPIAQSQQDAGLSPEALPQLLMR